MKRCPICSLLHEDSVKTCCGYSLDMPDAPHVVISNKLVLARDTESVFFSVPSIAIWMNAVTFYITNVGKLITIFPLLYVPFVGDALISVIFKQKLEEGNIKPMQAVKEVWQYVPSLFLLKLGLQIKLILWCFIPIYGHIKALQYLKYWGLASNIIVFEGLSGEMALSRAKELIVFTEIGLKTLAIIPNVLFVTLLVSWVFISEISQIQMFNFWLLIAIFLIIIPIYLAVDTLLYLDIGSEAKM